MKKNCHRIYTFLLLAFSSLLLLYCSSAVYMNKHEHEHEPPTAKKKERVIIVNDNKLIDNYFWLREKDNPQVLEYLEAENKYAEKQMEHTKSLQEKLYSEMINRIQENDITVPAKKGDYYYYYKTERGSDYNIFCRKYKSLDREEEILLDLNELADTYEYIDTGSVLISPDHNLLAYTIDTDGSEIYTLFIKDIANNIILDDIIVNAGDIEWGIHSDHIFFSTYNEAQRSDKIFIHKLGDDPVNAKLVFYEKDDSFYAGISKTASEGYFIIRSASKTSSEVYILDADDPYGEFELIAGREKDIEYSVDHIQDSFFIKTNENAKNFKIMKADKDNLKNKEKWSHFAVHNEEKVIENMILFYNHVVMQELENGMRVFGIIDKRSNEKKYIEFPEEIYSIFPEGNLERDTNIFRFSYTSFITPISIFDYNMDTGENTLLKETEISGLYDKTLYETERIWADSGIDDGDNIKIPISLVYRKDLVKKDKKAPLLLYAYGSYGDTSDIKFTPDILSLLDRGLIYAVAHIRGGGEMGIAWHEGGRLLNRKNSFHDFISCAEYLIRENYTSEGNIIIHGISAGGKVIGAVVNMRPDLFLAAIADVPFVDVLNTMLDPTLPLTVYEYDEWGNPNEEEYFNYILSYCPYQNIKPQGYPHMLITAGYNDPRVGYWEPAKFTAKLRELKRDDNLIILKTNMGSGHFGSTGRYDWYREIAFIYSYILDISGISQ